MVLLANELFVVCMHGLRAKFDPGQRVASLQAMRALTLLLVAIVAAASAQQWTGTWRSDYGDSTGNAPWYICVYPFGQNTKLYATYSGIGTTSFT